MGKSRAYVLSRLFIAMTRNGSHGLLGSPSHGSMATELALVCAIYIGQKEGRPMSAYKLSTYSGIPRPTVVRKLRELQARGVVEIVDGCASITQSLLDSGSFDEAVRIVSREVQRASTELSKLDRADIARRDKK